MLRRCMLRGGKERLQAGGSILSAMPVAQTTIRAANPADVDIITHHRRRMFVDAGRADNRVLDLMAEQFRPWLASMLAEGKYMGWLALQEDQVIGGRWPAAA